MQLRKKTLTKIVISSDWHLDATTAGVERLGDFRFYLSELEAEMKCELNQPDYFFFLGDAFDPGQKLGPKYTALLVEASERLTDCTRKGSVWVAGNHDVIEENTGHTTLSPLAEWRRQITPDPNKWILEEPTAFELQADDDARLAVLALPYVARAAYDEEVLDAAFERAHFYKKNKYEIIVLSHLTVPGATLGSESKELARGRDVDFPFVRVADLEPILIAQGHYHEAQVVESHGLEILIPGSPYPLTFGEARDENNGFTVVEL